MTSMAPHFRPWADLHTDLFLPIVDRLRSLRDCVAVRGVCTAWRSALPPGPRSPYLLVLDVFQPHDGLPRFNTHAYALSLPMQRTFRLPTLACHSSDITCSGNGYLTIADGRRLGLLNPVTGEEIKLLPLPNIRFPHRIVLRPNPRPDDYTAVAICGHDNITKVAYMMSGDTEWTISDIAENGSKLVDLVYERSDVYCLDEHGDVQVLHISICGRMQEHNVDPLLAERVVGTRFNTPLAPPYDTLAKKISFKRLFFCEGTLYQVWQNTGQTIRLRLREGGVFIMSSDEILVLRYYPERWPCWDAVKDLGGYSVFIGRNNTAVVQAEAAPGVRPNCVYWIDCGLCTPWVFDISNKTSTHCVLPPCSVGFARCWYFNGG